MFSSLVLRLKYVCCILGDLVVLLYDVFKFAYMGCDGSLGLFADRVCCFGGMVVLLCLD